jgi:hypothetical protein
MSIPARSRHKSGFNGRPVGAVWGDAIFAADESTVAARLLIASRARVHDRKHVAFDDSSRARAVTRLTVDLHTTLLRVRHTQREGEIGNLAATGRRTAAKRVNLALFCPNRPRTPPKNAFRSEKRPLRSSR